jgi:hypothetical protein
MNYNYNNTTTTTTTTPGVFPPTKRLQIEPIKTIN